MFQKAEAPVISSQQRNEEQKQVEMLLLPEPQPLHTPTIFSSFTLALLIRTSASEQNHQLVCNGSLERESSQNGLHPDIVLC